MTAAENLRQQYRVLGLPSEGSISDLLRLVGLEGAGSKRARAFSLGIRQRLCIAMALAGRPDFLILDEPTNGLGPQSTIEIRELILKLNREHGISFLISSHMLDELARLATHYGFLDAGRMIQEMSAEALQAQCRKCIRVEVSGICALAWLWSVWRGIREVAENLAEKMQTETNTLLCLSTGDRAVRALASKINAQLQALRRFRPFPLTV